MTTVKIHNLDSCPVVTVTSGAGKVAYAFLAKRLPNGTMVLGDQFRGHDVSAIMRQWVENRANMAEVLS